MKKEIVLKHATILAAYLFVVWGLYRLLFKLPEEVEELFVKPIIWLAPVVFFLKKENQTISSLGISGKKLFPAIYFVIGLGALFTIEGLIINFVKYGGLNFTANLGEKSVLASLGISFATAFSEEISFRGYLFNRLWWALGNEWLANVLTSICWSLIHIPITFFVWEMELGAAGAYLVLIFLFGMGSAFVFARTRNVFSSIFLHVLWEWPIILFR